LKEKEFASKPFCFGVHGVNIFQGSNLELQFKSNIDLLHLSWVCIVWFMGQIWQYKPFQTFLWCFTLKVFCNLCMFFSHNLKRHLQFTKLAKIMETKGNKILRNTKTRWISMVNLIKHVLSEYHTFLMKMAMDAPTITPI
jgi:hypothetical protein